MTDDWRGEHLIRSAKPGEEGRRSENARLGLAIAKRNGRFHVPLKARVAHGRFVRMALYETRKMGVLE